MIDNWCSRWVLGDDGWFCRWFLVYGRVLRVSLVMVGTVGGS